GWQRAIAQPTGIVEIGPAARPRPVGIPGHWTPQVRRHRRRTAARGEAQAGGRDRPRPWIRPAREHTHGNTDSENKPSAVARCISHHISRLLQPIDSEQGWLTTLI